MSEIIPAAVDKLNERLSGSFDGIAKFVIAEEGVIVIDAAGARAGADDEAADVTLSATRDTFEGLIRGQVNPASAFMTGKLKVDGNMGLAMKLGQLLA